MKAGIDYIGITTPFYCIDGKGRILLQKRSKNCRDEQGKWDCGGGKLEFGEELEQGVLREVEEEYGCKGKIIQKLSVVNLLRENNGQQTHWVAIPFIILIKPEEVKNNIPEKIDEIRWFNVTNLPSPLHSSFSIKALEEYIKNNI